MEGYGASNQGPRATKLGAKNGNEANEGADQQDVRAPHPKRSPKRPCSCPGSNPKYSRSHPGDPYLSSRVHPPHLKVHPYGMPAGWNVNTEEQPAVERHKQVGINSLRKGQECYPLRAIPLGEEKLNSFKERVRIIEGTDSHGLDAANLCLVLDIVLPADFKTPKFEKYKGGSCPHVHLAMYCRKMASYIHQDKILVHCFYDSLTGAALSWYVNLEKGRVKT
ncbi:hypothetical protein CR513_45157, partial [Mucuna pruriens]